MPVTQKCQYALRALFELAWRKGTGPVPAGGIAESQAIPKRFLEVILHQLRQGGFVGSQRGKEGGFYLSRPAESVTVGEIIRFMDGPINPVNCHRESLDQACPMAEDCVLRSLWDEAKSALEKVYDTRTLRDLVEARRHVRPAPGLLRGKKTPPSPLFKDARPYPRKTSAAQDRALK